MVQVIPEKTGSRRANTGRCLMKSAEDTALPEEVADKIKNLPA